MPAPVVQVENNVPAPVVQVENNVPAPTVTVHNELPTQTVEVKLPDRQTVSAIERDAKGNIKSVTQTETSINTEP